MPDDNEPLFKPAPPAPTSTLGAEPLKLDGIAVTLKGDVYFGHIEDEEKSPGRVEVTVPTAEATVRTVRHLHRTQIARVQSLPKSQILALAKIGSYVLTQKELESVVKPS